MAAAEEEEAAVWGAQLFGEISEGLFSLSADFSRDWQSHELRAAIFKLLLAWLILSLAAIQLAWRSYGPTVTGFYYRQGTGGQNGGTPEYPSHFPIWESSSSESLKTHQE